VNRLNLKSWAEDDRPREKLLQHGISALSDAELIAILIGIGNRELTAVELARKILAEQNYEINRLAKLSIAELMQTKGIGQAKAISIAAAFELGKRRESEQIKTEAKIRSSQDIYNLMATELRDLPVEAFWVVMLNRANRIIDTHKVSQGGISATVVDLRLVMQKAIEKLASGLVLVHNHPSGNLEPSEADKQLTQRIQQAAKIFDINVLDHIIIADHRYYSFADEGILS